MTKITNDVKNGRLHEDLGECFFEVDFFCCVFKLFKHEIVQGTIIRVQEAMILCSVGPAQFVIVAQGGNMPADMIYSMDEHIFYSTEDEDERLGVDTRIRYIHPTTTPNNTLITHHLLILIPIF